MANSFTGTFSTPAKEAEFMAATTTVAAQAFNTEPNLTGITMPDVTSIGWNGFAISPLTHIELPKVTLIGDSTFDNYSPFAKTVNAATTVVKIPFGIDSNGDLFSSTKYKDYMFGAGNWDKITFDWTSRASNSFTGTFSTPAKEAEFMAIITEVTANQFNNESGLKSISLPYVDTIGASAFSNSPLKSVYLPYANTIGANCFSDNTGTNQLSFIYAPEAAHVGAGAFSSIQNHTWTHAYLNWGFWTSDTNRTYIFGTPHTGYVNFLVDHENGFMLGSETGNIVDTQFTNNNKKVIGIADSSGKASMFIIDRASDPYNKPAGYADNITVNGVGYKLQHQVKFQVDRLNHFNNYFTKDTARTYTGNFGGTGNSILDPTTGWTNPRYAYYNSRTGNTAVAGWTSAQVWQEFIPSATRNPDIWTNMIVGIINHHGLAWLRSKEWIAFETTDKDGNGNYTFGFSPAKLDWRWAYVKV